MSSSLEDSLTDIQIHCAAAVIIITVVGYDYVLTLSREIDNIWCRPWTRVSVLFVIVRYVGLCWAVILALIGTIFVPGPVKIPFKGTVMLIVGDWGYLLFLAAADLVMILRVYAMWNQSKKILGILMFFFVAQVAVSIFWEVVYNNPHRALSVTVVQVLDFRYCSYSPIGVPPSTTYRAMPRYVLGAVLLIFAAIPTFKSSIDMYRLTKRWKTNRSMQLLLREGTVYFVVNLLFNFIFAIQLPVAGLMLFIDTLGYSLSCAIMPRFIISIRELYERDLQNRWQGIDTGFGVFSQAAASGGTESTTVVGSEEFPGLQRNADVYNLEAIRLA